MIRRQNHFPVNYGQNPIITQQILSQNSRLQSILQMQSLQKSQINSISQQNYIPIQLNAHQKKILTRQYTNPFNSGQYINRQQSLHNLKGVTIESSLSLQLGDTYRSITPKKLKDVKSPGLPESSFSRQNSKNRSKSNTVNCTLTSLRSTNKKQEELVKVAESSTTNTVTFHTAVPVEIIDLSDQQINDTQCHERQSYITKPNLTKPYTQSISQRKSTKSNFISIQSLSSRDEYPGSDYKPNKDMKSMIDEAVYNMFKKIQLRGTSGLCDMGDSIQGDDDPLKIGLHLVSSKPMKLEIYQASPRTSIERFTTDTQQSPEQKQSLMVTKESKYYVRPLAEDLSVDEQESESLALHSFNPQQFKKLIKDNEDKGVQTLILRDEGQTPEPELNIPYMHQFEKNIIKNNNDDLNGPENNQKSQKRVKSQIQIKNRVKANSVILPRKFTTQNEDLKDQTKLSVYVSQDEQLEDIEQQFVFQGNTDDKRNFIRDLQGLFTQYTKTDTQTSVVQKPINQQQYIKMSNLEEQIFCQQRLSNMRNFELQSQIFAPATPVEENSIYASTILSSTLLSSTQTRYKPCAEDIQLLLKSLEHPHKSQKQLTSKSPFLKIKSHITYSQSEVSEFKPSVKNPFTKKIAPQKKAAPKQSNNQKKNSIFDERTFKF